jgi:hypothetical protein
MGIALQFSRSCPRAAKGLCCFFKIIQHLLIRVSIVLHSWRMIARRCQTSKTSYILTGTRHEVLCVSLSALQRSSCCIDTIHSRNLPMTCRHSSSPINSFFGRFSPNFMCFVCGRRFEPVEPVLQGPVQGSRVQLNRTLGPVQGSRNVPCAASLPCRGGYSNVG